MTKIAVIGGGPGGYVAAIRAAQLGAEVTLVERCHLGGTCLNEGCIPTKALLHATSYLGMTDDAAACGVDIKPRLDWRRTQTYKTGVVDQLVGGVTGLLKANGVTVIQAQATFTGPRTLELTSADEPKTTLGFDAAIIATGSVSAAPPIPGLDLPFCLDSSALLDITEVPQSLVIIGGGVIGVEMATVWARMDCKVTIIEMMDEILPLLDREMAALVRTSLESRGVDILTGAKVLSVQKSKGQAAVEVECADGLRTVSGQKVLVAIGRRPYVDGLGFGSVGIQSERGRVLVDACQRTNVEGIYAVGDCTGGSMLAHVASAQGEVAAAHIMGHAAAFDAKTVPSCVYCEPEMASVGLSEQQAQAQGLDYVVGRFPLAANGKSLLMGGQGLVKLIAGRRYGQLLGMHMVGPQATELIVEGALALELEATLDELTDTIHAHPTVAEALREAALAAQGRAIHIPNP